MGMPQSSTLGLRVSSTTISRGTKNIRSSVSELGRFMALSAATVRLGRERRRNDYKPRSIGRQRERNRRWHAAGASLVTPESLPANHSPVYGFVIDLP